jgi:hypothetical protein
MSSGLLLILIVVGAYFAAHVVFEWLGRRLLIVSGAEYLLLGILLGPHVSGILSPQLVESFAPVTALALGWMGAIIGSRFLIPRMVHVRGVVYRVAFAESFITLWVVFGLELFLLRWLFGLPTERALGPALALGAFATASADAGIELAARRSRGRGPLVTQLRVTAGANAFVAICAFGILLASNHPGSTALSRPLTATEWTVVSIALGVGGGALFHLFLGSEQRIDRLFISLTGVLVLVSGAATYLRLSPLMSAMFFGAMLVNTSRQRDEISAALARVERPLYFVLLIFAGATWRPSAQTAWALPVLVFIGARALGKVGGARLAARANDLLPVLGPDWGRALLGQGGLVLALAINYLYQDTLALPNVVFTTAVISVLLTDLASGRLASSVLDTFAARMAEGRSELASIGARALGTAPPTDATPADAARVRQGAKEPS